MSNTNTPPTIITLTPVPGDGYKGNSYTPVRLALIDDAKFHQSSSAGGWQTVDRPKMAAATQWFDRAPWQISFDAYLDKTRTESGQNNVSSSQANVEDFCSQLKMWMDPVPGMLQPPVLSIDGPIPEAQSLNGDIPNWIMYSVEFHEAIRDVTTGFRILQKVSIVLYEYLPPLLGYLAHYQNTPAHLVTMSNGAAGAGSGPVTPNKVPGNTKPVLANDTIQTFARRNKITNIALLRKINNINPSFSGKLYPKYNKLKVPG